MKLPWKLAGGALAIAVCCCTSAHAETRNHTISARRVSGEPTQRVYIYSTSVDEDRIIAFRRRLMESGAEKVNLFMPSVIVCEVPLSKSVSKLVGEPGFEYRLESEIGPGAPRQLLEVKGAYDLVPQFNNLDASPVAIPGTDFRDVVVRVPPDVVRASGKRPAWPKTASGVEETQRNIQQNSEFLIGDILIQTVYPESDGPAENWTDKELGDASQGVTLAMLSFQQSFNYVPMSFVFQFHKRVRTQYEPIHHNLSSDSLWIMDCMRTLGVTDGRSAQLAVHEFNNIGRERFGTDWAFTGFVADSRNEPNHLFRGAFYTAYANLGGPFNVDPFPAGINDPNFLGETMLFSHIFQHETVHIFWGLDEYIAETNLSNCDSHVGYLDFLHKNKLSRGPDGQTYGCPDYEECVMWGARETNRNVCFWTAGQIGTVDEDENGIPDIFDWPPTVEFEDADIETVLTPEITVNMKAISRARPNRNPFQLEEDKIHYAAALKDALLSINGVGANRLKPVDGRWDETEEDLTVNLAGLTSGVTRVQIRTKTVFGRWSATLEKEIYYIGVNYSLFTAAVRPKGIQVTWSTVGESFDARLDLYRIDFESGRPNTQLLESDMRPFASPGEFRDFSYFDGTVKSGERYQYYVEGHIELDIGGVPQQFSSSSNVVEVRAMFGINEGEHISHATPNPFRDVTQLSVNIPPTYTSADIDDGPVGAAIQQLVATRVNITIYDVLGRPVRTIFDGSMFTQFQTFSWDGTNERSEPVPSGVYFVRTDLGSAVEVRKVVVIR